MNKIPREKKILRKKGAFILELLIVISLLAIILLVGSQVVFVSLQSAKVSGERDVAMGLMNETFEGVRSVTDENWRNLYALPKTFSHNHVEQSGVKWNFVAGDDTMPFNNTTYTKYFIVENVCRDDATRVITALASCTPGNTDDPGTQKVTVNITWGYGGTNSIQMSNYYFRWKNKGCTHSDWSGGATTPTDTILPCTTNKFFSSDPSVDSTSAPGSIKLN